MHSNKLTVSYHIFSIIDAEIFHMQEKLVQNFNFEGGIISSTAQPFFSIQAPLQRH
jgi:hypothetical protein